MHETSTTPGDLPPQFDTIEQLPGLQLGEQLRVTDKAVTVAGRWQGRDVVAKHLISFERHWRRRFAHEVSAYQAFTATAPPWRVPRLYHAGDTVLVIERLPGAPPHTDRYPPRLPATTVTAMIDALTTFAAWEPAPGPLSRPATDWPARIYRYTDAGDLPANDRQVLLDAVADAPWQFGHGDPLASNALAADGEPLVFIDFEFAGMYPPGADLALLGLWLGRHDPTAEQRCAHTAETAGHLRSYLAMRVVWLARERRLYQSLFNMVDDPVHQQWLDEQAAAAHTTLRRAARHV